MPVSPPRRSPSVPLALRVLGATRPRVTCAGRGADPPPKPNLRRGRGEGSSPICPSELRTSAGSIVGAAARGREGAGRAERAPPHCSWSPPLPNRHLWVLRKRSCPRAGEQRPRVRQRDVRPAIAGAGPGQAAAPAMGSAPAQPPERGSYRRSLTACRHWGSLGRRGGVY